MLYICVFSNKFDLNQANSISHNTLSLLDIISRMSGVPICSISQRLCLGENIRLFHQTQNLRATNLELQTNKVRLRIPLINLLTTVLYE